MIVLVLYDSRTISFESFFVLFEILVLVSNQNFRLAHDFLPNVRNAQAAFDKPPGFAAFLNYFGVDEHLFKVLQIFSIFLIFGKRSSIYYKQPNGLSDLWRGQSNTASRIHRFIHITDQLLKPFIRRINRLSLSF